MRAEASDCASTSLAVMMGVEIDLLALIISLSLGTPRVTYLQEDLHSNILQIKVVYKGVVTFIEATPAKWKVFSVICVVGSESD